MKAENDYELLLKPSSLSDTFKVGGIDKVERTGHSTLIFSGFYKI